MKRENVTKMNGKSDSKISAVKTKGVLVLGFLLVCGCSGKRASGLQVELAGLRSAIQEKDLEVKRAGEERDLVAGFGEDARRDLKVLKEKESALVEGIKEFNAHPHTCGHKRILKDLLRRLGYE